MSLRHAALQGKARLKRALGIIYQLSREHFFMSAFVISEVEILNEEAATQYRELAAASIAAYGGRYLARAAEAVVVEGGSTYRRIVIVEFDSMEQIHNWYASPEYAEALRFRDAALDRRLMFVNGVGRPPETT